MKKIIFAILAVCAAVGASAQKSSCTILGVETKRWHTIDTDWDDWGERDDRDKGCYRHHFALMEVGFDGLRDVHKANFGYTLPEDRFMEVDMGRSLGWTFNLVGWGTRITHNNTLGVSAAVGLTVNDYTFREATRIGIDDGQIELMDTGERLGKSKLNTVAIHIPVVMELNMGRGAFVSAGVFTDLIIGSHFKSKFPKEKLRTTYTNFGQFGVTARVGWNDFYVFGNYGFADLINWAHGPEVRPFSVGVGLGF